MNVECLFSLSGAVGLALPYVAQVCGGWSGLVAAAAAAFGWAQFRKATFGSSGSSLFMSAAPCEHAFPSREASKLSFFMSILLSELVHCRRICIALIYFLRK